MKTSSFFVLLVVLTITLGVLPAYAQTTATSSITVITDKPSYSDGDKIAISGTVSDLLNVPISIVIRDPSSNIVMIGQVTANSDKTFSTTVTAGGKLWATTGTYEIDLTYGSKANTAKTTFQFGGITPTFPIVIHGQKYNATYTITNGKVTDIIPNTDTKSLTIQIQPSGSGTLSITLPRLVIDAKNGSQDSQFVVQADSAAAAFNETKTDTNRTLTVSFGADNKQITIIGTQIIPEFGSLAIAILAMAVVSIIVLYKKALPQLRVN